MDPDRASLYRSGSAWAYTDLTFRGWFDVDAEPILFPASTEAVVFVHTPFSFAGFLRGFSGSAEVFAVSLMGQGNAGIPYVIRGDGRYEWEEGRLDYIFS